MFKRKYLLPILILPFAVYLYLSYIRIYNIISKAGLKIPYENNRILFDGGQGTGKVKYVILGDSLGAGVGSDTIMTTYPYLFSKQLLKNYQMVEMINLAYPGDKTEDVIKNQLPQAINENPGIVTLMIGTNDVHAHFTTGQFYKNYSEILNTLKSKTSARIVVINLPYLASDKLVLPPYNYLLNLQTQRYNGVISRLTAGEPRIKLVDLYSSVYEQSKATPGYYSADYFHPSGIGYTIWSKYINAD